jgi:hypothetical protein
MEINMLRPTLHFILIGRLLPIMAKGHLVCHTAKQEVNKAGVRKAYCILIQKLELFYKFIP